MNNSEEDYQKWLKSAHGIYDKFRGQMVDATQNGMKPDPFIVDMTGGYYLFRRPHPLVWQRLSSFGEKIKDIAPNVLVYKGGVLHSTFTDYQVKPGFTPSHAEDHIQVIKGLDGIVKKLARATTKRPQATYKDVLFGLHAFMLEGEMDQTFYEHACIVREEGEKLGMNLRLPWGTHITFARTSGEVTPTQVKQLVELCRMSPFPPGSEYPFFSIEAGWYTMNPKDGFVSYITSVTEY